MAESKYILEEDQADLIRRALLIGLASYAEIERLEDSQASRMRCGFEVQEDVRVIHPTGSKDTLVQFAAALRSLEYSKMPESEFRENEAVDRFLDGINGLEAKGA